MPKIFDAKRQSFDRLFDMIGSKCIIVENIDRTFEELPIRKCELCDDDNSSFYRCIKCRKDLCTFCMSLHVIKENNWYECENCESIFNNKNDLQWIDGNDLNSTSKNIYLYCKECITRSRMNKIEFFSSY